MKKLIIIALLALLLGVLGAARKAVIIGNSDYQSPERNLTNPVNDARLLESTLSKYGFQVSTLLNATRSQTRNLIHATAENLAPTDDLVFYFSGHGIQVNGINYLIPVGSDIRTEVDCEDEAITANWIVEKLSEAQNSIFILDACRDNPFIRKKSSAAKGLAAMKTLSGKSQLIIFATEDNQVAYDGKGINSPFAEALVHNIDNLDAKLQDMLPGIKRDVLAKTANQQSPTAYGILMNDFYFKEKRSQPVVPTAPADFSTLTWKDYDDPVWGISFRYPSHWQMDKDFKEVVLGHEDYYDRLGMYVMVDSPSYTDPTHGFSAEEYARDYLSKLMADKDDDVAIELTAQKAYRMNGEDAYQLVLRISGMHGLDVTIAQMHFFQNLDTFVLLGFQGMEERYPAYEPVFEQIHKSFRLRDPSYVKPAEDALEFEQW